MAGKASTHKVKIKPLVTGNPFIKTPDEIASLFGLPVSIRSKLKFFGKLVGEDIPLSNRSLDNLSNKGVSENVVHRALEPLAKKIEEMIGVSLDESLPDGTRESDVDILLQSGLQVALHCFSQTLSEDDPARTYFQPLELFVERRCREFQPQKEWLESYRNKGATLEDATRNIADFYRPIMDKTMLSQQQVDEAIFVLKCLGEDERKSFDQSFKSSFIYFYQDFNLAFFAALDLCIFNFVLDGRDEKVEVRSVLIPVFEQKDKCYFGKFLSLIKEKSGLSNVGLSNSIAIETVDTKSGRTLGEAQLERLKEWKKGKNQPSYSMLSQFCSNLSFYEALPMLFVASICLSIDRLVAKCTLEDEKSIMREIYSVENYRRYYLREKEAAV